MILLRTRAECASHYNEIRISYVKGSRAKRFGKHNETLFDLSVGSRSRRCIVGPKIPYFRLLWECCRLGLGRNRIESNHPSPAPPPKPLLRRRGKFVPRARFAGGSTLLPPSAAPRVALLMLPVGQSLAIESTSGRFQALLGAVKTVFARPVIGCLHVNFGAGKGRRRRLCATTLTLVQVRNRLIQMKPSRALRLRNGECFQTVEFFVNGPARSFLVLDGERAREGIEKQVPCVATVQSPKGFAHAREVTQYVA